MVAIKVVRREDKEALFIRTRPLSRQPGDCLSPYVPCFVGLEGEPELFDRPAAEAAVRQFEAYAKEDAGVDGVLVDFEIVPMPA